MQIIGDPESREISLYFHIPFCQKKCPYCHFYVQANEETSKDLLLDALLKEWQLKFLQLQGKYVQSIYFGGGTPTLFGIRRLAKICALVLSEISDQHSIEITIEANPESLTYAFAQDLRAIGFNRLSIGAQTLDPKLLQVLGRSHSAGRIIHAVHDAASAGFENISVDVMYDLPHQTYNSWQTTVGAVAQLPITHISLYNLTFEEKTPFYRRKEQLQRYLPKERTSLQMLEYAVDHWQQNHFDRYEISAFAKPSYHSRHNTGYWLARPFLGYGPSAFSFNNGQRFKNISSLKKYAAHVLKEGKNFIDFEEKLPFPQNLRELLAVQLRMTQGVNLHSFINRHGCLDHETRTSLNALASKGLLTLKDDHVALTEKGMLFYDSLAAEII